MSIVRDLAARLGLDFEAEGFLKAQAAFEVLKRGFDAVTGTLDGVVDKMREAVVQTAEQAEHIDHLSQRTGIGAEALQEIGYAAGRSEVSLDQMATSLGHLGLTALAASKGSAEAKQAFAAVGVSATDGSGKIRDSEELFTELAEKISVLPDGLKKTAMTMALFGKSGGELVPVFDGLQELRDESHQLGVVMDEETLKSGQGLNAVFEKLRAAAVGTARMFAGPLLQPLRELGEQYIEWRKANAAVTRQRLEFVAKAIAGAIRVLAGTIMFVVHWSRAFALVILSVAGAIGVSLLPSLWASVTAFFAAGAAGASSGLATAAAWVAAVAPFVVLTLLIAAMLAAANDVYNFMVGNDSLIGDLGPKWTKFLDEFLAPREKEWWLTSVLKEVARIITDIQGSFEQLGKWIDTSRVGSFFNSVNKSSEERIKREGRSPTEVANGMFPNLAAYDDPAYRSREAKYANRGAGLPAAFGPELATDYTAYTQAAPSPVLPGGAGRGGGASVQSHVEMPVSITVGHGDPQAIASAVGQVVDERIGRHLQEAAAATQ